MDPDEKKLKFTVLWKMQQPMLTRWWTVGAGASFVFDYYLAFFHACQTVINVFDSVTAPNGIASDLFSMMANPENFIDLVLIRCFNKAYINHHFDWMQTCKDLAEELGFQAHNTTVRFFIMDRDIRSVMFGVSMDDYHEAIEAIVKNENEGVVDKNKERTRHLDKLRVFLHEAHESLHKHFPRWTSRKLIPAALLAEGPLARVVAAAMLKKTALPTFGEHEGVVDNVRLTGRLIFNSTVHKQEINLLAFDCFIRNQLETIDDYEYPPQVIAAAELLWQGTINLREINYGDEHADIRWFMHSTYLPVPSILQFVESGVKEAKYVSATDRSEAIRTCLAIIRSATPLGRHKSVDKQLSYNANKILGILLSASNRSDPHIEWERNQVENSYHDRLAQVHYSMKQGHFRDARVDTKKSKIDESGIKFKRPNVAQQPKKQTLTSQVTGLIPYGKLTKTRNMLDLEEELLFRNVPIDELPTSVTERKAMLKNLEIERLTAEGIREEDAANLKTFKPQSNAPFRLTDA